MILIQSTTHSEIASLWLLPCPGDNQDYLTDNQFPMKSGWTALSVLSVTLPNPRDLKPKKQLTIQSQ